MSTKPGLSTKPGWIRSTSSTARVRAREPLHEAVVLDREHGRHVLEGPRQRGHVLREPALHRRPARLVRPFDPTPVFDGVGEGARTVRERVTVADEHVVQGGEDRGADTRFGHHVDAVGLVAVDRHREVNATGSFLFKIDSSLRERTGKRRKYTPIATNRQEIAQK